MRRSLKALVRQFLRRHLGVDLGTRRYFTNWALIQDLGQLIDRHEVDAVFDVGANRGQFCRLLRRNVGYRGLIFSFEPVQACVEDLRPQVARDPRWFLYDFALGRRDGTGTLHVTEDSRCSSFLDAASDTHGVPVRRTHDEEVPIRSLESVFPEIAKAHGFERAYLKLDTQGYDLEVIHGAGQTLQEVVALQTELSFRPIYENIPDYPTVLAELASRGFEVSGFYPAVRDEVGCAFEMDCILIRRSATGGSTPGARS